MHTAFTSIVSNRFTACSWQLYTCHKQRKRQLSLAEQAQLITSVNMRHVIELTLPPIGWWYRTVSTSYYWLSSLDQQTFMRGGLSYRAIYNILLCKLSFDKHWLVTFIILTTSWYSSQFICPSCFTPFSLKGQEVRQLFPMWHCISALFWLLYQ